MLLCKFQGPVHLPTNGKEEKGGELGEPLKGMSLGRHIHPFLWIQDGSPCPPPYQGLYAASAEAQ